MCVAGLVLKYSSTYVNINIDTFEIRAMKMEVQWRTSSGCQELIITFSCLMMLPQVYRLQGKYFTLFLSAMVPARSPQRHTPC